MKTYDVHHWRFLTEFLSFMRLMPTTSNDVFSTPRDDEEEQQGLFGDVHSAQSGQLLYDDEDDQGVQQTGTMPSQLFEQQIDELIQEIDRLRNNRIVAVADLNKAGIPGRSSRDATVRVIFLTDVSRPDSLTSAALYAEQLKAHYRKYERQGHQALINTTALCLSNPGEAGPPNTLLLGLMRNNSWDHLDTLILSENYREDAARIAGTMQAYLAELLLYVLLIVPPFNVNSATPATSSSSNGQNANGATQGRLVRLPPQTYVVGLAALEYSARWGRRWLSFGLAKEAIDVLRQKPADGNKEKIRLAEIASAWFKDWRNRVQSTIPDHIPGDISALQGIHQARQEASAPQDIFSVNNPNPTIGKSTIRDLQDYQSRLAQTYVSTGSEPALQDALLQSTYQIMQELRTQENKELAERKVTELGALQVEAEQILGHPKFFTGATGSVPRARTQLWAIGAAIAHFQQEHQKNPLNPLTMKDTLQSRREELEKNGNKMISDLQKHLEHWPLFTGLLPLKMLLAILTLLIALVLGMGTVPLIFAWLHHLLVLKAPNFLPYLDAAPFGASVLTLFAWVLVIVVFVVGLMIGIPNLITRRRSALQVELVFLVSLLVFVLYGFAVNLSINSLKDLVDDPTSVQYLAWLAPIPIWSLVVFGIAALLIIGEVIYFFWWLRYLYRERRRIADVLQAQHERDIQDVIHFIADDLSLELLTHAELADGDGGLGNYYFRVAKLCDLLDEAADKALRQQQMANHRLLMSQSETQLGADRTGRIWLNLHIRDEKLETDTLADEYKGLRRKLLAEPEELRELAEYMLRAEGVEKPIEIGQQFEERLVKGHDDSRRLQILITALVAMAMRFAVDPLSVRDIDVLTEEYRSTNEYTRQHMPALNSLVQTLNKKLSQATFQFLAASGTANKVNSIDPAHSSVATDAIATWSQLFWQTRDKDGKLEPILVQEGVLKQLARLAGKDYNPRAVMRQLLAHTALFGRSLKTGRGMDLYLLLAPSPQSYEFRQGLKSMKLPRILEIPDLERILLLAVKQYVAEPMLLTEPKLVPEPRLEMDAQEPLPPSDQSTPNGASGPVPNTLEEDVVAARPTASSSPNGMHTAPQGGGNGPDASADEQNQDDTTVVL